MSLAIRSGGLLYLDALSTLGLMTLPKGHGWLVFLGRFFPVPWLIMRPAAAAGS